MIELIRYDDSERWNEIVKSFRTWDTYYTCQYATSFMNNEDGIPYLVYYVGKEGRLCYPIVEKDIAEFVAFEGGIPKGEFFDWNTPYGYGGPISDVEILSDEEQECFRKELYEMASKRNIVSQFIRFHPILQNQRICERVIEHTYVKDTVYIDLSTQEDMMIQMESKNRNLIRKAIKNGVSILHDKGKNIDGFIDIYEETMIRDNARQFYFFPRSYYEYMYNNMSDEVEYFYAKKDGKLVAASIFFCENGMMHYHLSGNYMQYRTFAPTNLLLYEAANWGRENGMRLLHLGGGVGIEDSLFHFKKQFNKEGRISFYIGRNIFDKEKYQSLLNIRREINPDFDRENGYYIQYRMP